MNEIACETALKKLKRRYPYSWDLNIYRGCAHGCRYCYAIYSHDYLKDSNYFENIYVKTNIVELLESELKSENWKREVINIGGVTDSYQPCEEDLKIMPEILKLLIKYKTPAIISTKSDLILRDYKLIDKLSRITYVNIAATVTSTDESIQKLIEPNSSGSKALFEMLKSFRKTNASIGLHMMPIIPFLTDNYENIEDICFNAQKANVHYMLTGTLYLRGKTRKLFFDFMEGEFPHVFKDFSLLYKTGGADKSYKQNLYKMVNELRDKYSLSSNYSIPMKEKMHRD